MEMARKKDASRAANNLFDELDKIKVNKQENKPMIRFKCVNVTNLTSLINYNGQEVTLSGSNIT